MEKVLCWKCRYGHLSPESAVRCTYPGCDAELYMDSQARIVELDADSPEIYWLYHPSSTPPSASATKRPNVVTGQQAETIPGKPRRKISVARMLFMAMLYALLASAVFATTYFGMAYREASWKLASVRDKYRDAQKDLEETKQASDAALTELETTKQELNAALMELEATKQTSDTALTELDKTKQALEAASTELEETLNQLAQIRTDSQQLEIRLEELNTLNDFLRETAAAGGYASEDFRADREIVLARKNSGVKTFHYYCSIQDAIVSCSCPELKEYVFLTQVGDDAQGQCAIQTDNAPVGEYKITFLNDKQSGVQFFVSVLIVE